MHAQCQVHKLTSASMTHRKAVLKSGVDAVELGLHQGLLYGGHCALNVIVGVADHLQRADLRSETVGPLVNLRAHALSFNLFMLQICASSTHRQAKLF